jgi:aryl-alcohol dehydrogenase-like predicted oxidoreductase
MQTRRIGSLQVSVVGLGCNNFGGRLDAEGTAAVVHAAIDAGISFLDTADVYGGTKSEEYMGRALKGRRDRVVLATKFGGKVDEQRQGAKAAYVRQAAEESLRRLATDRIDLYQYHWPDPTTPIAETLGALDELVKAGKVREIGCSNFSVDQIREARSVVGEGGAHFVSVQNQYSLLHRQPEQDGVLAECERSGLAFLPFFPLASGLLTGKYRPGRPAPEGSRLAGGSSRFMSAENVALVEELIRFAEGRGHTILELAFSWLLARPAVASVIAGATKLEQVRANVAAANLTLSAEELAQIDAILSRPAAPPATG